jgi:hypothetical protein
MRETSSSCTGQNRDVGEAVRQGVRGVGIKMSILTSANGKYTEKPLQIHVYALLSDKKS